MSIRPSLVAAVVLVAAAFSLAQAPSPIRLVADPALSPDGKTIAFSWRGDLWSVPSTGGNAVRLTFHEDRDATPKFSHDGKTLAFVSNRTGSNQIFTMPASGGAPSQVTLHTEGYDLESWMPDGKSLLVTINRDHYWRRGARVAIQSLDGKVAPEILFDDYADSPSLSPDGRWMLFTREDTGVYRKGYRGSQEAQLWLYDRTNGTFRLLRSEEGGSRWPMFGPDSKTFYWASAKNGTFNLYRSTIDTDAPAVALTDFKDDGVLFPTLSADGSTIVFRVLFDLYRLETRGGAALKLDINDGGDPTIDPIRNSILDRADDVAFTSDGREIAFIAGGDLYVMDTVLCEPVAITQTPEEEADPVFTNDNASILFVSDMGGTRDIWRAERNDKKVAFWQNSSFALSRVTNDPVNEWGLRLFDKGKQLSYYRDLGEVWAMNVDGTEPHRIIDSWSPPRYDFSPDAKWVVYDAQDQDYNADIWIKPLDGSAEPFNVSCHPDNDVGPVWSSDGKVIAFVSRRYGTEADIVYAYVSKDGDEESARDRKLEKALEKMKERSKSQKGDAPSGKGETPASQPAESRPDSRPTTKPEADSKPADAPSEGRKKGSDKNDDVVVKVDIEGLRDRLRRISIPDSFERGLFFYPETSKLLFSATTDGKSGIHVIEFPDELRPKMFLASSFGSPKVLAEAKMVGGLADGKPATITKDAKVTSYGFSARQRLELGNWHRAIFDQAWLIMRDRFYDERLGNKNWDAIRRKYAPAAAECRDAASLSTVCNMMLGELNASHLGFSMFDRGGDGAPRERTWRETTWHLGCRFDPAWKGPGLKIKDVIRDTPAAMQKSRLSAGDVIITVNGQAVDPGLEIATVMTLPPDSDVTLLVRGKDDKERTVTLRPTTYGFVRAKLYDEWMDANRAMVDKLSEGKFGYLHIQSMGDGNLQTFETELYRVAAGKEGLVIDVRENGGGSIADHLLTCLTQPVHAITRSRKSGEGYPQDRKIYASWNKPIVVLCNQNSFSNAEIFPHAIKTLKRGRIVGIRTAGGVISTGAASIMGVASIRTPGRGWHLLDGEDMELNGCIPDFSIWPQPLEMPAGIDKQLEKAVSVLKEDVDAWKLKPRPVLKKASER